MIASGNRDGACIGNGGRKWIRRAARLILLAAHDKHRARRARQLRRAVGSSVAAHAGGECHAVLSRLCCKGSKAFGNGIGDAIDVRLENRFGDCKSSVELAAQIGFTNPGNNQLSQGLRVDDQQASHVLRLAAA